MKRKNMFGVLLTCGFMGVGFSNSSAQDTAKPSPEVEAKVTMAIRAVFPEVVVNGIKPETENGISFYEVKFTSQGKKMDGDVTADGTLLETEEASELSSFPAAAQEALKKATKGFKVGAWEINRKFAKAEKDSAGATKVNKLSQPVVAYEADVEKDGKKGEFAVSADGKLLETPQWAKATSKEEEKEGKEDKD